MRETSDKRIILATAAAIASVAGIITYFKYRPFPIPPTRARVEGKVLEVATEYPIEAAKVEIFLDNIKVSEMVTRQDGTFTVDLPIGNYIGTASAQGYTASQMWIYVFPEDLGRTLRIRAFNLQRTTPIWATIVFTNTGWLIPIAVDGEIHSVSYNVRSPKLPWPISVGRYVEAPEQSIDPIGRLFVLTGIELSVTDRDDVRVWEGTIQNREYAVFPGQYADWDNDFEYLWSLKVVYSYA